MTTTENLNNGPTFFSNKKECLENSRLDVQTNPRYKRFTQKVFHAGDEEQFQNYMDTTNGKVCMDTNINLKNSLFANHNIQIWNKNKDLEANAVINTFRYIFHKFKKGIFVKIQNNKLTVFLPFSKANFVNEWSHKIKVDNSKYTTVKQFLRHISNMEGRYFKPQNVNDNIDEWYGNNCILRYENPISEGESNVGNLKNMLEELCEKRKLPDTEFFINRRDFPIITRDGTEPYNNIWGSLNQELVSHNYKQYVPILSMSGSSRYADILMPTWEDWARVQSYEDKWFPRTCRDYIENFDIPWNDKKPCAVFRGGTTGCGVTINDNPRLKISYISATTGPDENGVPYLDAGVTNWNLRPRKIQNEEFLKTIEIENLPFNLVNRLSPKEQSGYKYIVNIDGHVNAFRLSLELSMGSVVLLVDSPWKIWFRDMLIPYEHYVPVSADLSNLIDQIKWCRNNDDKCKQITKNSKDFFNKYLQKKAILDYMQKVLIDVKNEVGVYLYNENNPLDSLIDLEYKNLDLSYPLLNKNITNINSIPSNGRSYGLLQGMEWVIRKVISEANFEDVAQYNGEIFRNKLGVVRDFTLANFSLAVKTTSDKQKIREHIHETFIGTKSINELSKLIPNFAYIFGMYKIDDTFNVVTERIQGQTLHNYIKSKNFNFEEYLFILLQISLAIQVAQNTCGMVHYDLTPWNIMLQRLENPIMFEYMLKHDQIIKIKTSIVPVIIDYGKSHVIQDNIHHGFINMFNVCSIQDIITLLVTSTNQIIKEQTLSKKDFGNLLFLGNFMTGTRYHLPKFEKAKELRDFTDKAKRYSSLIYDNKYELKKLGPYDLIKHIMKLRKSYQFKLGVDKKYNSILDKNNSRQVFEYIFSNTVKERIQSYENVFIRVKHCSLPQPKNLFFVYYASQQLEHNLITVKNSMIQYLKSENVATDRYEKIYIQTMNFLGKLYMDMINKMEEENIMYNIDGDFKTLTPALYTDDTFLSPKVITEMIESSEKEIDLSEYKEIIENILINDGKYKLREKDREYYLSNFKTLLSVNNLNMKNNSANRNTLKVIANRIYKIDYEILNRKISQDSQDCKQALEYLNIYKNFI